MSKLACHCGCVMAVHTMEEEFLYNLIHQSVMIDLVSDSQKMTEDEVRGVYLENSIDVYICPSCGRVLIENKDKPNQFTSYKKED